MKLKQFLLVFISTFLLFFVGCKKNDYPTALTLEGSFIPNSGLVDIKSYVGGWIDSIEMNSFDWNSKILFEAKGEIIGWGIPFKSDNIFFHRLLIVNDSLGYPGEIYLNEISLKENDGLLLPLKLNRKDIKRGTNKIQNLSNSIEKSDSLITIFSHPSQPATSCPECTLPDVIIYAKGRSTSDNMNITPGPGSGSYIQASLLGLGDVTGTSGSIGSAEGGSSTNAYYVLVTPPENGNLNTLLDLGTLNDSEVSGGNLYTPYYYPGQDKGMEWAWWRKLDRDMFASDAHAKSFEHLMISLYVSSLALRCFNN